MLFDSHAHLDDSRFDADRHSLIAGLPERGITRVLNAGADMGTSKAAVALAADWPYVYASVGIHPHDAKEANGDYLAQLSQMAAHEKVVAVGEIGLDYYYDFSPRDQQKRCFEEQLDLADNLGLPVIIHDREAHGDMIDILKARKGTAKRGVLHCFSGSWEMAKICMDLGFYISLGGPVTFKNAVKAVEVAQRMPMDRLLIETDSPYLAPHPHRGKRNDPGLVRHVAERIAGLREISFEAVAAATLKNGETLFGI